MDELAADLDVLPTVEKEWRTYIEQLLPLAGRAALLGHGTRDAQWRHELYEFLFSQIAVAYVGRMYNGPKYPDFAPMYNQIFNQGFPNPDDSYYLTPVEDHGIYKISGFRGTVRLIYFEVGSGMTVPYGTGTLGPSKAVYDVDTLQKGADGSIEFILSAERPAGYEGDWWKLDAGATYFIIRQRSYDWLGEIDGRFAIERLDLPASKPRPSAQDLDVNLSNIAVWADNFAKLSLDGPWVKHLRSAGLINKLKAKDYSAASGLGNQRYVEGLFELADDEALVIETDIPSDCSYWNFQLVDDFWRSIDWVHHQSSLNGFTARLDEDGKFRAVVSIKDPGVPNWLDTVGRTTGQIYGRWTNSTSEIAPLVTKIKVADVRQYFPAQTPVVTPEERDAAIRLRRKAAQLRRRW